MTAKTQSPTQLSLEALADLVADSLDADVMFYNAPIERNLERQTIDRCLPRRKRKNAFLILVTNGGDPDAAYRIARFLQQSYEKFTCAIPGLCKSAGTLLALGAHELVFGPHGELGPIDIQLSKRDEIFEMQSGLTVMSALESLQGNAFEAFEHYFLDLQRKSGGKVSLKTAAEIAARLVVGLFSPIYQQIDPMHIGEAGRASLIANQYGDRLNRTSKNLQRGAMEFLTVGYTSHSFVIDEIEAKQLFLNVRQASENEMRVFLALGDSSYKPGASERVRYLSSEPKEINDADETEHDGPGKRNAPGGTPKAAATSIASASRQGNDIGSVPVQPSDGSSRREEGRSGG